MKNKLTPIYFVRLLITCLMLFDIASLLSILMTSCSKYQVVSEVRENMYHLHQPKTKKTEIVLTKDSLIKGEFYSLKQINIIPSPYYSTRKLKRKYQK